MNAVLVVAALGSSDCERIGSGWLAQPANAVSSLAYAVAGAWLLHRATRSEAGRPFLAAAGTALGAVGVGSVAYHGPQPAWAGAVHDGAIVLLVAVLAVRGAAVVVRAVTAGGAGLAGTAGLWWTGAGMMAAALVVYALGRTTSSLCRPEELWQLHALWHVFSAGALGVAALALAVATPRPLVVDRARP